MAEELLLGTMGGGGVRMRSSKLFQNVTPPPCLAAWFVNVSEDRRRIKSSLFAEVCSKVGSEISAGSAGPSPTLGEEAVVVGAEADE